MNKLIFILLFAVTFQVSAQDQTTWITDYKEALKMSEAQNKPILAFVVNNEGSEAMTLLKDLFFLSDDYKNISSKVIPLKVDISDQQSYNVRLGIHYTKQRTAPGLALVDKNSSIIGKPLVIMNSKNIAAFLSFINSKN